ncbi:MAG: pentapeptide repeat-containing protein [Cyclobacteriaceae bacterium]
MKFKGSYESIFARLRSFAERPLVISLLVLLFLTVLVLSLSYDYYLNDFSNFWREVLAEAHGMLFDIAIIGILIYWLNNRGQRKASIRTYIDEIEDFRSWKSEEAAFRTVGNIKRLNRHKIYQIDLASCYLNRTNLSHVRLDGANLNSADMIQANLVQTELKAARLNRTNFSESNLNHACLHNAYATGANFENAYLIKADLSDAFLIATNFENAFMMEANLRGAYVEGANFKNANLYKADLRGASGLTVDQLMQAHTLHQTLLDEDLKARIAELKVSLLLR